MVWVYSIVTMWAVHQFSHQAKQSVHTLQRRIRTVMIDNIAPEATQAGMRDYFATLFSKQVLDVILVPDVRQLTATMRTLRSLEHDIERLEYLDIVGRRQCCHRRSVAADLAEARERRQTLEDEAVVQAREVRARMCLTASSC
jgi:hypothetical protein